MAERSGFWTTNGTGDGASSYAMDFFSDFFKVAFTNSTSQGPFIYGGKLAVTSTASNQVTVADGYAMVYGYFYENQASQNFTVPTPTVGTTGYAVVLRANYAAQTIRITLIKSNDGVAAIPALTNTVGVTQDIPLASFQINLSGQILSLTDTRNFCHFSTLTAGGNIDAQSITGAQIANNTITATQMANNSINSSQLGNVGSASNMLLGNIRIQTGQVFHTNSSGSFDNFSITFPVAFSAAPIVTLGAQQAGSTPGLYTGPTATGFTLTSLSGYSGFIDWVAIGLA